MMHQDMLMLEGASTGPVIGDRFDFLDIFFSYQVRVCVPPTSIYFQQDKS